MKFILSGCGGSLAMTTYETGDLRSVLLEQIAVNRPGITIVLQFESTPKAFANCRTLSGFDGFPVEVPRVLAMLEPWAPISQRLRRIHAKLKLMHYSRISSASV